MEIDKLIEYKYIGVQIYIFILVINYRVYYSLICILAATVVEHAHYLSNKEITISNRIYGIECPRLNVRILPGKPTRPRRVVVDLKVGRYIGEYDTIINLIKGNPTIITKGQRLEMVETYRYPKRY